jgi:feruloyl esterase
MYKRLSVFVWLLSGILWSAPVIVAAQQGCEGLTSLKIPNVTFTLATAITAPPDYVAPNPRVPFWNPEPAKVSVPFCRVAGYVEPAQESHIGFEIWLPLVKNWNGKYLGIGTPGMVGYISYGALARNVQNGYATASTDTGHVDTDTPGEAPTAEWAGNTEKVIDWGHRAQHLTTVIAKEVANAYYGTTIKYAYWNSCHEGGNQALTELQRYPGDFDGIVVGGPAYYMTRLQAATLNASLALVGDGPESPTFLPTAKYPAINRAALDACDDLDGVHDGVIDDPTRCRFDPASMQCPPYKDEASCLTASQVEAVRKMYAGAKFADGTEIYPGYEPGSELRWDVLGRGPGPIPVSTGFFQTMVYPGQNWDYHTFDVDRDTHFAEKKLGGMIDSMDPNLKPFKDRGGKTIMFTAWEESAIPPRDIMNYYRSVVETMGGLEKTQDFARLFMVAGMGMCPGFRDPGGFDTQKAIEQWVEKGVAPDTITSIMRTGTEVHRTRPVCAYPTAAIYNGSGDPNVAASYQCRVRE